MCFEINNDHHFSKNFILFFDLWFYLKKINNLINSYYKTAKNLNYFNIV